MNQITPQQYKRLPQPAKDYNTVRLAGLIPMDVLALRQLETGEFRALVIIPLLNDNQVREVRLFADDQLVLEKKEPL